MRLHEKLRACSRAPSDSFVRWPGTVPAGMRVVDSKTSGTGVVWARYERAGGLELLHERAHHLVDGQHRLQALPVVVVDV